MDRRRTATALAALATLAALLLAPGSAEAISPPVKLKVDTVSTTTAEITWRGPSGATRFEIQHRLSGVSGWTRARVGGSVRRLRISGMPSGRGFELRARASAGGCSRWSATKRQTTLLAPFKGPHPDPGCQILPPSDAFHTDVSGLDPAENSDAVIARILADGGDFLHPDFGSNPGYGIPFYVVPAEQTRVPVRFGLYPNESERGPQPLPPEAPVEGRGEGDSHILVIERDGDDTDPDCRLVELYRAKYLGGVTNAWRADQVSEFDLGKPLPQRSDGWTSADAAGLPILPGLVLREEVDAGLVDHAIRITFERTRAAYISPATHLASDSCNASRPPMGMRLRLDDDYSLTGFSQDARVIATALKTYGAIVADNGSNFYITGSTDPGWDDDALDDLKSIPGSAFEVVDTGAELTVADEC